MDAEGRQRGKTGAKHGSWQTASRRRGFARRSRRVELPGLRSRMLDTTEPRFIGVTRRTSLRQALTRCVCRMVSGVAG